jgi:putative NADH-flavin reductase
MTITVFGASGNIGRLVVQKLLADGHNVTVFVHSHSPFELSRQIKIVKGDTHNAAFVEAAVRGSDVIISTLGSWHTPTKDIVSSAMRHAIPEMQKNGIKRIITLTGSAAWAPGDTLTTSNKLQHRLFSTIAGKIIKDSEDHLQLLHKSGLEWTCLRSPIMKNGTATEYVLNQALPKAWETITRETVAQAIIDQLTDTSHYQQAPQLHAR